MYSEIGSEIKIILMNNQMLVHITAKSHDYCPYFTEKMFGGDGHYDKHFLSVKECAAVCQAESQCFSASYKDGQCYLYSQGGALSPVYDPDSMHMVQVCNYGKSSRKTFFIYLNHSRMGPVLSASHRALAPVYDSDSAY